MFSCNLFNERTIMAKYLLKRIIHGLVSIAIVIAIVMIMIYSLLDRNLIFAKDTTYSHQSNNQKEVYKYAKWEEYGYLDYVPYADWLQQLTDDGEIDEETRSKAVGLGRTEAQDSELVAEYVEKFKNYYESKGYKTRRLDEVCQWWTAAVVCI